MAKPKSSSSKDTVGGMESPNPGRDEVESWLGVISRAETWFAGKVKEKKLENYVREYALDWAHIERQVDIVMLPLNLVFAYVKTEIARLYFRDPWITVNPKRSEDLGAAHIAEQLINYLWGELNLKLEIKNALLDTLLVGFGWIKLGYSADIGIVENKSEKGEKIKKEVVTNEYVKSEDVFAYHVPWKNVIFPADSLNPPHDSRWIAFKIVKPLRAIKGSGIYEHTDDLKPTATVENLKGELLDVNKDVVNATIYEIWDMENRRVRTISHGVSEYLRDVPWPYRMKGYPAVRFYFNPVPGDNFPLSDVAPGEPQIVELMKMMAIMINHLKRWNRQIFTPEGFMTDQEMEKFKKSIDGAVIKYTGKKDDFFVPPYAAVQQDIYGAWNILMDMWRNVSGQSDVERGAPAQSRTRTLGEIRLQMQGNRARSDEKVDMLEEQIAEVARKLMSLMKQFFTVPRIVRIVGTKTVSDSLKKAVQGRPSSGTEGSVGLDQTENRMFSIQGIDLPENPDIDVLAGSTIPLNKENKLNIVTELLKITPAFGIQPGSRASREFGREILRDIDIKALEPIMDIADAEAEEQQQQMQQMQEAEEQRLAQEAQMKGQEGMTRLESTKTQLESQKVQSTASVIQAKLKLQESLLKHMQLMSGNGGNGKISGE